jgi:hypothetical protein
MSSVAGFEPQNLNPWLSRWKALLMEIVGRLSKEVADEVGISIGSSHTTSVKDLGMHWVSAKFVPRPLTGYHKLQWFSICENHLQMSLLLMKHGFTIMMLKPNNTLYSRRVLFCLASRKHDLHSLVKEMLLISFDHQGIVRYKFASECQTTNHNSSLAVLRCLRDAVCRKWPEMWTAGSWLPHAHTVLSDSSRQNIQFLPFHNPPIHLTSPVPTIFYSLNWKLLLKEEDVKTVEDIVTNSTNDLKAIPQRSIEQCFQKWKRQQERCIAVQEDYFEGDNIL